MRKADATTIGARLTYVRDSRSQRVFADEVGVPLSTYQTYEQDRREPDLRTLTALFEAGWNLNWVLTGEGPERLGSTVADQLVGKAAEPSVELDFEVLKTVIETVESALELANFKPSPKGKAEMIQLVYRHLRAEKTSSAEAVSGLLKTIQEAIKKSGAHAP